MNNFEKYEKTYFMPPVVTYDWVKKTEIEKPGADRANES